MEWEQGDAIAISRLLRSIASSVGVPRWDEATSARTLVPAASDALRLLLASLPPSAFQPLLPAPRLSAEQLQALSSIHDALKREYLLRRRMLIERAQVTAQAFLWSPKLQDPAAQAEAAQLAAAQQAALRPEPGVHLQDVFCACAADVASVMNKPTSTDGGLIAAASVKSVLIGSVPDRGGRPGVRRGEASMPQWAPRKDGGSGGGGGDSRSVQQGDPGGGGQGSGGGGSGDAEGAGPEPMEAEAAAPDQQATAPDAVAGGSTATQQEPFSAVPCGSLQSGQQQQQSHLVQGGWQPGGNAANAASSASAGDRGCRLGVGGGGSAAGNGGGAASGGSGGSGGRKREAGMGSVRGQRGG